MSPLLPAVTAPRAVAALLLMAAPLGAQAARPSGDVGDPFTPLAGALGAQTSSDVAIDRDRRMAASLSPDRRVVLWDVASGDSTRVLDLRAATVYDAAGPLHFTLAGVLVAGDSGVIITANVAGEDVRRMVACHPIVVQRADGGVEPGYANPALSSVAANPASLRLSAAGCSDGQLTIWDGSFPLARFHLGAVAPGRRAPAGINALAFSDDGRLLAAATGSRIHLLHLTDGVSVRTLGSLDLGAGDPVRQVAFASGGSRLVAMRGEELQVWSLVTREREHRLAVPGRPISLAVGERSQHVAVAHTRGIKVWQIIRGDEVLLLRAHAVHGRVWFADDDATLIVQPLSGRGLQRVSLSHATTGGGLR